MSRMIRHYKGPRVILASLLAGVLAMFVGFVLPGCGAMGTLVSTSTRAAPTAAGNGRVSTTNVAGLYADTTVESPNGRELVAACIEIQRGWNDYLRSSGMANTQGAWWNWMQMQRLATVADRCIDYATYGQPMSGGSSGGYGMGGGNMRGWAFKACVPHAPNRSSNHRHNNGLRPRKNRNRS
jgi:hypothetical protein